MKALKRVGRRDDVADVIAFLALDGAAALQGRASRLTADRALRERRARFYLGGKILLTQLSRKKIRHSFLRLLTPSSINVTTHRPSATGPLTTFSTALILHLAVRVFSILSRASHQR